MSPWSTLPPNQSCHNPNFWFATKAKALLGCGPRGSPGVKARRSLGVTSQTPGSVRKCEGVNPHIPKVTPTLGDGVPVDSRSSESDLRGQNSMAYGVLYIIEKLLKRKCLKWARIVHLNIWNVSYGQKKGRESNYQFDSRPQKVGNRLNLLSCRGHATYRWKALNESYNFTSDRTSIEGLLPMLWGSKVVRVLASGISGLPLGSPEREKPFGCRLRGQPQNIL
jgi:hypothetical protein